MTIGSTSLAGRRGALLPVWLARAGLPLSVALIVCGVVGLLPQLQFALLGLWLSAVAFALMIRPVRAQTGVPSPVPAIEAASVGDVDSPRPLPPAAGRGAPTSAQ